MQKLEQFITWLKYNYPEAFAFFAGTSVGIAIFGFAILVIGVMFKFGAIAAGLTLLSPWFLFLGFYIHKYWKEVQ